MGEFGEVQRVMDRAVRRGFLPHQHAASGFGAWVQFQDNRLEHRVESAPILETNDKRLDAMHHRPPLGEQQTCPFGRAWHERLFVLVEYEYHVLVPFPLTRPRKGLSDG